METHDETHDETLLKEIEKANKNGDSKKVFILGLELTAWRGF